jgi:hypothetical protein
VRVYMLRSYHTPCAYRGIGSGMSLRVGILACELDKSPFQCGSLVNYWMFACQITVYHGGITCRCTPSDISVRILLAV